jgi:hypothetical protein
MWIRRSLVVSALLIAISSQAAFGQAITPMELQDPKMQHLQQRHLQTLMLIGKQIEEHKYPYPFYLCRTLDVDIAKIQAADLRSIRFESYQHKTVLSITGNYYASYSAERMDTDARLKETFRQVVVPILQAEAQHFPDDSEFSAFAIEVSHHVRRKAMGMSSEVPENVAVIIPVGAAQKFVDAKTDDEKQSAILDAEIFLNGEPQSLWLREGAPPEEWKDRNPPRAAQLQAVSLNNLPASASATNFASVSNALLKPVPARIITPESLAGLQRQNQDSIDRMRTGLDSEAHFVPYAPPPSFIGFRQGSYLQLSTSTPLDAAASSRYKLAALAFDEHISHLIRPLLDYFPADVDFDGVDFSTSIHVAGDSKSESVEFFLTYRLMKCFASYDCTGQQLLDAGTVIINGERAALDLQIAEGKN